LKAKNASAAAARVLCFQEEKKALISVSHSLMKWRLGNFEEYYITFNPE
jgi:hypothetical protein